MDIFGIFSSIAFLSVFVFIFKNKNLILISKSIAPSGMLFTLIALVTGSIWGKPTWGTWWAWDARITSMLILFIIYTLYFYHLEFLKIKINQIKYHQSLQF